jgi:hypothetical protein
MMQIYATFFSYFTKNTIYEKYKLYRLYYTFVGNNDSTTIYLISRLTEMKVFDAIRVDYNDSINKYPIACLNDFQTNNYINIGFEFQSLYVIRGDYVL